MPTPQIDPKTGERIPSGAVQIDPTTGERVGAFPFPGETIGPPQNSIESFKPDMLGDGTITAQGAAKGILPTASDRLFGAHPLNDSLSVVGSHLKNLVAGPYNAFTEGPQNPLESQIKGTDASGVRNVIGQFGLGMNRMFTLPSINALSEAKNQQDKGNLNGREYDDQGNYHPSTASSILDAIPIAGPMARGIDNDAHKHGILPALLGGGIDVGAAELGGKVMGAGTDAASSAAQFGVKTATKGALTDLLAPGTSGELLTRALKPPISVPDATAKFGSTIGDVIDAAPARPTSVNDYKVASDAARKATNVKFQAIQDPIANMPVSTQPIADAIRGSVSRAHEIEDPLTGSLDAADTHAKIYDDYKSAMGPQQPFQPRFTLGDLNDIRKTKNAQLQNVLDDTPADRNTVLTSNPTAARLNAARESAADTQYEAMSGLSGIPKDTIQGIQNKYGDLRDVSDIANKRDTVYGRQNPVNLAESIGFGHGIQNFLSEHLLKNLTGSDALVDAATRKAVAIPRPTVPSGLRSLIYSPVANDSRR